MFTTDMFLTKQKRVYLYKGVRPKVSFSTWMNEFISICRGITSIVEMVLYNRINRFVRKEVLLQGDHKGVFDIIMESVSFVVYFIGFIYMEIRFSLVQPYMNVGRS